MRSSRVLIVGAAGLVGQNLAPRLLAAGKTVVAVDKNGPNLALLGRRNPGLRTIEADLCESRASWDSWGEIDTVVDLKAQITAVGAAAHYRNNMAATEEVLELCRRKRVQHLIHLSSTVVISSATDAYAESKRAGEQRVASSVVPHTILRPALLYGPFDVKHLGYIARLMERWPVLPVPGSGRYVRQPVYVGDLCGVIERCVEGAPAGAIHNIVGLEKTDFIDLLRILRRERGLRCWLLPVPLQIFHAALEVAARLLTKPPYTRDQLEALQASDVFPVDPWPEIFGVPYTSVEPGLRETARSARHADQREMRVPE